MNQPGSRLGRTKAPRNLIGWSDWKPIVTVPESLPENDLCPANGTAEFPSRKCGRGTEEGSFRSALAFIVLLCTLIVIRSVVFFWQLHVPSDSSAKDAFIPSLP